jgi:hypothetical protein
LLLSLIKHHNTKAYGELEVFVLEFRETAPIPGAGLETSENRKMVYSTSGNPTTILRPSSPQPRHYTDGAIPTIDEGNFLLTYLLHGAESFLRR